MALYYLVPYTVCTPCSLVFCATLVLPTCTPLPHTFKPLYLLGVRRPRYLLHPVTQPCWAICRGPSYVAGWWIHKDPLRKEDPHRQGRWGSLQESCLLMTSPTSRACLPHVTANLFFENCMSDMCNFQGVPQNLCSHLSAFTETCQEAGYTVKPWREPQFCREWCPQAAVKLS